ncbi:hypothetical protein [uncultured Sulfitobacter sp.]|uniref:hypothetical protein n=1 Tax=uncultured Sulfitobacter sp. TaxID=191468 RepID=UPI002605BEA2|nr:hypothetical protein [uncultured Sulfitobacter sp.]
MQLYSTFLLLSPNARFGSVALLLGGIGMCLTPWIDGAGPMRLLALSMLVFGQLCYAQEAGWEKPLTKLVVVALIFASLGFILFELDGTPKAALLFAFAGFVTVLSWSLAMLHRPGKARATGKVGMVAGGASLAILIGGHVFVGFGAAIGLGALRSVATAQSAEVAGLVQIVSVCLGAWAFVCASIVFKGLLNEISTE